MDAPRAVEILVVSPAAGIRLACVDGWPVVRIEVVEDAGAALAAMNGADAALAGTARGCALRRRGRPPAWREHRLYGPVGGRAPGVAVVGRRIVVRLPDGVGPADFRARLLAALEPLAVAAIDAAAPVRIRAWRQLARDGRPDMVELAGAPIPIAAVPRSYALDVGREAWLLFWIAAAARAGTIADVR